MKLDLNPEISKRLREKIKGGKEWELQTVWGVGYKFEVR